MNDCAASFVRVCGEENDIDVPLELPLETDSTLRTCTLTAHFPGATGLRYKPIDGEHYRGVRLCDSHFYPPRDGTWTSHIFYCVYPKDLTQRGADANGQSLGASTATVQNNISLSSPDRKKTTCDLIVLGMTWRTDESEMRKYFSNYGSLILVQLKRDPITRQSRGFGFIRFSDYGSQVTCLSDQHCIDGRWCEVKIPNSKIEGERQDVGRKIFVGRLTDKITRDMLQQHFSNFGQVLDVFIPKTFRSFAFVTFSDGEVAQSLIGQEQDLPDGSRVTIGPAAPKLPEDGRRMLRGCDMRNGPPGFFAHDRSAEYDLPPGLSPFPHHQAQYGPNIGTGGNNNPNDNYLTNQLAATFGNLNLQSNAPGANNRQYQQQGQFSHAGDVMQHGNAAQQQQQQQSPTVALLNFLSHPNVLNTLMTLAGGNGNGGNGNGANNNNHIPPNVSTNMNNMFMDRNRPIANPGMHQQQQAYYQQPQQQQSFMQNLPPRQQKLMGMPIATNNSTSTSGTSSALASRGPQSGVSDALTSSASYGQLPQTQFPRQPVQNNISSPLTSSSPLVGGLAANYGIGAGSVQPIQQQQQQPVSTASDVASGAGSSRNSNVGLTMNVPSGSEQQSGLGSDNGSNSGAANVITPHPSSSGSGGNAASVLMIDNKTNLQNM